MNAARHMSEVMTKKPMVGDRWFRIQPWMLIFRSMLEGVRPHVGLSSIIFLMSFPGLGMQACTASRRATTWEEDEAAGVARAQPVWQPHQPPPKVHAQSISSQVAPRADIEELAHRLELELIHFTATQPKRRQTFKKEQGWPPPITRAFADVLDQLEKAVSNPPGALPRRLIVQARVTIEAEFELTERRFGPPIPDLSHRAEKLYAQLSSHLMASPKGAPRPSLHHAFRLAWPVSPLIVTSPFGFRRDPILGRNRVRFHAGIDLGGERGDVVSAAAPGVISGAGWSGGRGRAVTIQHAGGYTTTYAHLRRILVRPGQRVEMGTPLGLVGSTGRSTGPHLHFEVRSGSIPIDPLEVLDAQAARVATR